MNRDSCYAFYGSLRQGMYNYKRYQKHLNYLFTENLSGFNLYALERYPIAVKTNSSADTIKVEVMQIIDPIIENEIHQLEMKAGYYYEEVFVGGLLAGIYLFHENGKSPLVPGGDWVQFFGQQV